MTTFVDGNILYAAQLNQLRLDAAADATEKDNAVAATLRDEIDDAEANAAADATNKDTALAATLRDEQATAVAALEAADQALAGDIADLDTANNAQDARLTAVENAQRDTGMRNINEVIPDRVSGEVHIRRYGNAVVLTLDRVALGSLESGTFGTIPLGFRPQYRLFQNSANYYGADVDTCVQLSAGGSLAIPAGRPVPTGSTFNVSFTYLTSNAWPTTLPGTPA